jgi:hypothetical protein
VILAAAAEEKEKEKEKGAHVANMQPDITLDPPQRRQI